MGEKLWDVTMQLTCMEEKRTEMFAENTQKTNFIRKMISQTEGHKHNIR